MFERIMIALNCFVDIQPVVYRVFVFFLHNNFSDLNKYKQYEQASKGCQLAKLLLTTFTAHFCEITNRARWKLEPS